MIAVGDSEPVRRVMAIGVDPQQRVALLNQLNKVVAAHGQAVLLVPDAADWLPVQQKIQVVSLAATEPVAGPNRLLSLPAGRWLGVAVGLGLALRPPASRRLTGLLLAATLLKAPARRRAPWTRAWLTGRVYQDLRPWVLWRAARPLLGDIEPETLDEIIQRDPACWGITWHLVRLNPAIAIGSSPDPLALAAHAERHAEWRKVHGIRDDAPVNRRLRRRVGRYVPASVRSRLKARRATG